jgi:DNA-binding YbaB/EbfC family protein
MNINPFDILKNAQGIQDQIARVQSELATMSVTGSSGGGIVKVTMNGQFELLGVELDPVAVDPRDIPMLQDLIVAAHANASEKVKEIIKEKLGPMAGGFPGL